MNVLGLFVKHPKAGTVKTRLAAAVGDERAATIYGAFIADIAERFRKTGDQRVLCYWPPGEESRGYFRHIAKDSYELWEQPPRELGARMESFFQEFLTIPEGRGVVIGSDSPTLPRAYVEDAFRLLSENDCVIGPATDGGYYLVGQRGQSWPIFDHVEWSSARVLEQSVARIEACGARLALLNPWYDVDTPDDWDVLRGHVRAMQAAGIEVPHHTRTLLNEELG